MLDVSTQHPFNACVAFAIRWLEALARYDIAAVEALIDVNDSGAPLAQSLPAPDGFTYGMPEQADYWAVHFFARRDGSYGVEFGVPFAERKYREMMAIFDVKPVGERLEVHFVTLKPS